MAVDSQRKSGETKSVVDSRDKGVTIPHPVIGIVKDNIDAAKNGKIRVYLTDYGGSDPKDRDSWVTVSYMSPWFGSTKSPESVTGEGEFLKNNHSYGFWATSPDLESEVICVFVNGRPEQGYYIGCLPKSGAHFMVPAIGASNRVVPNDTEATTYGGADRLPTVELNIDNPKYADSSNQLNEPKPVHSYQASILFNQGLIRDNIRGVVGSTSMRETPSAVFGISTPGAPIWDGGYTRQNIKTIISDPKTDSSKLKIVGRQGGHSLVMDDGELLDGRNQMIRLRSAGGHQITMSDDGQVLFITHSNGQSWVELGPEGTVDIFSTNSFNVRTQGDINFHADNDINLNAARALNISADSISIESAKGMTAKIGADFLIDTAGKETHKTGGAFAVSATGAASLASSADVFVNGGKVNLNTGSGPSAVGVPAQGKTQHTETGFTKSKGWFYPSENGPTVSVTSRLPTHQPFIGSKVGVCPKTTASTTTTSTNPSPAVSAATVATATPPPVMTNTATVATTPTVPAKATDIVNTQTVQALTSQNSVSVAMMSATEKSAQGILPGAGGLNATQAEMAGYLKPGTAATVMQNLTTGMSAEMAAPPSMWTGKDGIKSAADFAASNVAQSGAVSTNIQSAANGLVANNVITGKESLTQIGGVINAAFKNGVDVVSDIIKTNSNLIANSKIGQALSAGTFAAGLADKVTSGISGLGKSLNDLGTKASGLLTGLQDRATATFDSLKGTAKSAFEAVESSFANLKGGVPNVLGGGDTPVAKQASPTDQAVNSYESAKLAAAEYEDLVFSAKKEYRNDPSETNLAKLKDAEAKLASAKQQQTKASQSFLSAVGSAAGSAVTNAVSSLTGGLSNAANSATTLAKTTLNSGINALPGGIGALQIDVASTITNLGKNLANQAILSKTGLQVDIATAASKLTAGLSGISPTTVASDTVDTAAQTAKTGQLLGDARIPLPNFSPLPPPTDKTPTQIELGIAAKAKALDEIKAANSELNAIALAYNADPTNKALESKFNAANARADAAIAAFENLA